MMMRCDGVWGCGGLRLMKLVSSLVTIVGSLGFGLRG